MNATPDHLGQRDTYGNQVKLHSNAVLSGLQLFLWLFFYPSAWRHSIAHIDPTLRPNFCLAELHAAQWRNPTLQRLLLSGFLCGILVIGTLVGLVLALLDRSTAVGLAVGIGNFIALSIGFGIVVGVATGLTTGMLWGMSSGFAFGLTGGKFDLIDVTIFGLGIGISLGLGGILSRNVAIRKITIIDRWPTSIAIAMGTLIGGAITFAVGSIPQFNPADFTNVLGWAAISSAIFSIVISARGEWRRSIILGVAAGLVIIMAEAVVISTLVEISSDVLVNFGVSCNVLFSALAAFPYAVAKRLAGHWAAGVATTLGSGIGWMTLTIVNSLGNSTLNWSLLTLSLLCTLLGLTLAWWYSTLLYPLELAWGILLYYLDKRGSKRPLLRLSPAFWDEPPRWRLYGLDSHIVLVAGWDENFVKNAIVNLTSTPQRWAAQAAQIELEARRLEQCTNLVAIGNIHKTLATGDLEGPASKLLNTFSSISKKVEFALRYNSALNQLEFLDEPKSDLEQTLRTISVSNEHYTIRFHPVAMKWQTILDDYFRHLEEKQEISSPYIVGMPLLEKEKTFIGREDVSIHIETFLRKSNCPPLLLYGQRRMGKTSLLNNLGRLLPDEIVSLYVDLQGCTNDKGHATLLFNIVKAMRKSALNRRGINLPDLLKESLVEAPFTCFSEWLDSVEQIMDSRGCHTVLLTFDELETLYQATEDGRINERSVLGMLRHLIQHRQHFKILLASSHTLDELQRWSSYLINVQTIKLGYLEEQEARTLIERPTAKFMLQYQPEACRRVIDLTNGHPFLLQALGHAIVNLKNEQDFALRHLVCLADVEAAVPEVFKHCCEFFLNIKDNQTTNGQVILQFIAAHEEGVIVSQKALELKFPSQLDRALNLLQRRDVIEQTDGGYRFQVELIRRWFAQSNK
jgi:hypothetical protein